MISKFWQIAQYYTHLDKHLSFIITELVTLWDFFLDILEYIFGSPSYPFSSDRIQISPTAVPMQTSVSIWLFITKLLGQITWKITAHC